MDIKEITQYEPFRTLWRRDKKPNKVWAVRDCEYVYYMYSCKADNPYRITPEEDRKIELQRDIYKDEFRTDVTLEWSLEKWKRMNLSVEEKLLNVSMRAALKLIDYLEMIDWDSRAIDVSRILSDLDSISKAKGILDQLKKIKQSADANAETTLSRGQMEVSEWENPDIAKEYDSKPEDTSAQK